MRLLRAACVLGLAVLGLVLVSGLARLLGLADLRPDPLLPVVFYLALRRPLLSGGVQVLLLGYLGDLFSGAPVGLHALAYLLTMHLFRLLSSVLDFRLGPSQFAAGALAVAVSRAVAILTLYLLGDLGLAALWTDLVRWPALAICGALLTPPVVTLLRRIDRLAVLRRPTPGGGTPSAARTMRSRRVHLATRGRGGEG